VRKVRGLAKPSRADEIAFARAVEEIAASTERLLFEKKERRFCASYQGFDIHCACR
jgi:hypothetical protein